MPPAQTSPFLHTFTNPFRFVAKILRPSETAMLSPLLDVLMAGGISILLYLCFIFFIPSDASTLVWGWTAYYLSFIINYPHFAASYQLLYGDAGHNFFGFKTDKKFALKLWWAGLIVPVILMWYFFYALAIESTMLMGYLVNALFFFVGWHYVKQIFGTVIVLSAAKKIYYSKLERWAFLIPLYTLWFLSYTNSNLYAYDSQYFGIPFSTFDFPDQLIHALYIMLAVSTGFLVLMLTRRYMSTKTLLPFAALCAFVSIYLWFLPTLSHPFYLFIIPFLHSLQYLLFVGAYKRNQALRETQHTVTEYAEQFHLFRSTFLIGTCFVVIPLLFAVYLYFFNITISLEAILQELYATLTNVSVITWSITISVGLTSLSAWWWLSRARKKNPDIHIISFLFQAVLIGMLLFSLAPVAFDILSYNSVLPAIFSYDNAIFGPTLYLFFFTIFVNIHHYFVDNVIWRRDNPHVKENLYYRPSVSSQP